MTEDYESAVQSKTDVLEKTNERLFDLLEQKSSGSVDVVEGIAGGPPSLEPWGGGSSTSYVVIILVVVVVCLLVFMIFFTIINL